MTLFDVHWYKTYGVIDSLQKKCLVIIHSALLVTLFLRLTLVDTNKFIQSISGLIYVPVRSPCKNDNGIKTWKVTTSHCHKNMLNHFCWGDLFANVFLILILSLTEKNTPWRWHCKIRQTKVMRQTIEQIEKENMQNHFSLKRGFNP